MRALARTSLPQWMTAALVGLTLLCSQAPPAQAQCIGADGLSATTCCAPATATLPVFTGFTLPAAGLEWESCHAMPKTCGRLEVSTPEALTTACGTYTADIAAVDCAGPTWMKGTLTLDYTRTWLEAPLAGGPTVQVWRFAAKVDMGGTLEPAGAPVPPCATEETHAFYYGYVDFAFDCVAGVWQHVVVLYHNCDRFIHSPEYSTVPGTFHPGQTYALVGPDTAANPFTPAVLLPSAAPLLSEAVRTTGSPLSSCLSEEPLLQGSFVPQVNGCACPIMPQPALNSANVFNGAGACGTSFQSLNLSPTAPWQHLVSTSIGTWTTSASYPGPEHASVAEGVLNYRDGCFGGNTFEIFYGGMTDNGYGFNPVLPLAPPSLRFLDLASNYSSPIQVPPTLHAVGTVRATEHLIYANL